MKKFLILLLCFFIVGCNTKENKVDHASCDSAQNLSLLKEELLDSAEKEEYLGRALKESQEKSKALMCLVVQEQERQQQQK